MSAGLPPPITASVEAGTPPMEWSESIPASHPAKDTPATFSELPRREDNQTAQVSKESKPTTVGDQPSTGGAAMQTTQQWVPGLGFKATVASRSLSKEKKGLHVSLPSTELKGAQPCEHTGGVGALPGNLSESSVALLPDERQERVQEQRPASPRQRRDTIKLFASDAGDKPRGRQEEEAKVPREAALFKGGTVISEQSDVPAKSMKASAAETVKGGVAAGSVPGVEPQEVNETKGQETLSSQEKSLDQRKYQSQDVQEGRIGEERTTSARKAEENYGEECHPTQLRPPRRGGSATESQDAQQQDEVSPATSTSKRASMGAERKPGFMTMVKGEMKILAGKVSGDEDKVEEGKRLVHGDA